MRISDWSSDVCSSDLLEVVIAVRAAALNRLDLLQRQGPGLVPGFALPHVAGMDVAGEVVSLGEDVTTVSVGARVVVHRALVCGACDPVSRVDHAYCTAGQVVGGPHPARRRGRCAGTAGNTP